MLLPVEPETCFENFQHELENLSLLDALRNGVVGESILIPGLNGPNKLIYADYVASGRALRQIENFIQNQVLPLYSNSHTEASYCGAYISGLRRTARKIIATETGANDDYAVIFSGAGATSGLNRLVGLFGVSEAVSRGENPLVLIGPYEHHSNILPWRESGAQIVEIPEAEAGGPDLVVVEEQLKNARGRLVVGAFSAASNVTGILTDIAKVTQLLKTYNAKIIWDFAGAGPYIPINMVPAKDIAIDAVVISAHKFLGGPGASGVLILRKDAVVRSRPTLPGGGSVTFVSPWGHDYTDNVAAREEAGTPNSIGDIRSALCFMVKKAIGADYLSMRQEELNKRARKKWAKNPNISILGNPNAKKTLPIFSLLIRDPASGGNIHQQLFTRMLSDVFGIQARGGCACAGPYAHRLMGITREQSQDIRTAIGNGQELEKPGWTRLNLSVLLTDEKANYIIDAVDALARDPHKYSVNYKSDAATARFKVKDLDLPPETSLSLM